MKDMEDYIDFPCSSDWLDFYHSQGLTPKYSGRRDKEYIALLRRIEALEKQNAEILQILKRIVYSNTSSKPNRDAPRDPQWLRGGEDAD